MTTQLLKPLIAALPDKVSLRLVLIVPFLIQIVGAVGLVGYLSFRGGRKAVTSVTFDLCAEISDHIDRELHSFLNAPHIVHQNTQAAIELGYFDVRNLTAIRRFFWQQVQISDSVKDLGLGNTWGEVIAVSAIENGTGSIRLSDAATGYNLEVYRVDAVGEPTTLANLTPNFDPVQRPWYQTAAQAHTATWTEIYPTLGAKGLAISAVRPIYDSQGNLEAVLYDLMHLSQIGDFLQTLEIGKSGQSFIIESSGELVATSTGEALLRQKNTHHERLQVTESSNAITQKTGQFLLAKFGQFDQINTYKQIRFNIDNQPYYLQVLPFKDSRGLHWLVAVVVPEADFMEQIYISNRNTGLLCVLAFVVATTAGIITARWLTKTIKQVSQASTVLAHGDRAETIAASPIREINILSQSFNCMAQQLQASLHQLETKNAELQNLLEALPVGIAVHDTSGAVIYFNQMAKQILHPDGSPPLQEDNPNSGYQVFQAGTDIPYPIAQLPSTQALQGKFTKADDLEVRIHARVVPLEVWGTPVFNQQGRVEAAIMAFQDISDRKRAEAILANYSRELATEVSQRTLELANMNAQLHQEIQERQQAELALRLSQQKLQLITDSVPVGIAYVDAERRYQFVNRIYEKRFDLSREEIVNKHIWDIMGLETYNTVKHTIDNVLNGITQQTEFDITYKSGKVAYINSTLTPHFDQANNVIGYFLVFVDLTERRQLEESLKQANTELKRLATVDGLTRIANRRKFDNYLAQEWKRLARTQDPLALILFDIDFFKPYNDYYGHQAGDACLIKMAQAIKNATHRSTDLVARYGGEEFAVILPNTSQAGAITFARRIHQIVHTLAIPHIASTVSEFVTVSIGIVSLIPTLDSSPESMIAQADKALYKAKQKGRNCYQEA